MRICGSFFAAIGKNKREIDLIISCFLPIGSNFMLHGYKGKMSSIVYLRVAFYGIMLNMME